GPFYAPSPADIYPLSLHDALPISVYGTIGKGIAAYFKKINDEGGINGRKINFITLDDGYSPPKTVEMVRRLVEQEQVLFLFQTLDRKSTRLNSSHEWISYAVFCLK